MNEEDDVLGPLSDEQRMRDRTRVGAEHAERLVAHLPAVAYGQWEDPDPTVLARR